MVMGYYDAERVGDVIKVEYDFYQAFWLEFGLKEYAIRGGVFHTWNAHIL